MPEHDTDAPEAAEARASALDIDWLKTLAGALAAVTTAVLLSTLGAAGTLIGAAVGSVAATVGSAVYAQGLSRSRDTVRRASETARMRLSPEATRRQRAAEEARAEEEHPGWRDRLAALPWRRIGVLAAATFVVVVLALTAFEQLAGRSVSSYTGGSGKDQGSTIGGVTGTSGDSDGGKKDEPGKPDRSPSQSPSGSASESPSEEPSETPSESPSEAPSATPTPTPTPSPSATPTPTPSSPPSASGTP